MAKKLEKIFDPGVDEVVQNFIIESWHVSQSVDAFTGVQDYDITISGSFGISGSTFISGSPEATGVGYSTLVLNNTTKQVYVTGSYGGGGAVGAQGAEGAQGAQGASVQGAQGAEGAQGAQGASVQGAQGADGAQGAQGASVQGAQGAEGAQGISGGANITGSYTGSLLTNTIASVNWTGSGVQATNSGNDLTVYIPGGGGSTDYISDVTYETGSIDFTGVGNAFDGVIDISDLTGSLLSTASFNAATSSFLPDTPDRSVQFNDNGAFGGSDLYYLTSSGVFTSDATLEVTGSYVNLIKNKSALDWGKDAATGRLTINSYSNRTGSAVIALPGNKDGARPGNLYISNNHEALPRFFVSSSGKVAINYHGDATPATEPQFTADVQMGSTAQTASVFISGNLGVSGLPTTTEPNILYYNTSSGVFSYATNTPTVAAYSAPIANSMAVSTGTVTTASWGTPTVSNPSVYSYNTGSIAVLSDGVYSISFQGFVASSYSVNSRIQMGIFKNGVGAGFGGYATDTLGTTAPENDAMLGATIILSLTAGDTIEVGGSLITGGGTGTMAFGNLNYGGISITKLS